MQKGTIYLLPVTLGNELSDIFYTKTYINLLENVNFFIVENIKRAQIFIKKIIKDIDYRKKVFYEYSEHTRDAEIKEYINILLKGNDVVLMSEAGAPCIADPGYKLILLAHKHNIKIVPYIGYSSIILSLMASGLPAQKFRFEGYLPIKKDLRKKTLKYLEKISKFENTTIILMETPYRTYNFFIDIINTLQNDTLLCVASNVTQSDELIKTCTIKEWNSFSSMIRNVPTIFILYAGKI
ncbi:MAG: SAM-dependent methyltransferase [Bacteroidales bacterium]|nr:SAM-dependent methyltransferase [Bacteroidales bacterium]